ncbi:MAG: ATP-binding protein [Smithellaceae bacterium]
MTDRQHSDEHLAHEIRVLRQRLQQLEQSEIKRKRIEKILIESEQRLRSIIDGSPIPAFMIGNDHRIIYWNKALEELSRIKAREVIGTNQQWRAFYKKKRPCMADLLVNQQIDDVSRWYEGKYIKSNLLDEAYEATDFFPELGEKGKWLRFTAAVIRDADKELVGVIETLEDITARKKAEAALMQAQEDLEQRVQARTMELARANEALLAELMERHRTQQALKETTDHLSLILESLPIVSYTRKAGGDCEITFVSNTIEEITGYTARCFLEEKDFWKNHIHPDDCQRVVAELQADRPRDTHRVGYRFRVMDDSYRWFSDYWRIIPLPAGLSTYIVGAWQDVTEDKKVRQEGELRLQQMMQTHKLTALGEVVTGVAHEINNPISFIAYNVPVLEEIWNMVEEILSDCGMSHPLWQKKNISQQEVCKNMREIIQAFTIGVNRVNRVIKSLKEFSRFDEATKKKSVSIQEVIDGALIIVGAQVRRTVSRIDQEIAENIPPINGHFQKIEQVIANLLINAHQAIPDGQKGRIIIRARYLEPLKAVVLEIEDNGKGIEKETMDHIFNPFFTTRRDRDGTGLGLSISYGLVKEHHGIIGVLSRPGIGSRFSIFLPVDGETNVSLCPAILCIDHNIEYLKQLKTNFVDAVIWRSEPGDKVEDIISFLEEYPEVDIVVSEIRLKGFEGWNLLESIRNRFPLLPVILYASDKKAIKPPAGITAVPDLILQKPFNIDKLQKTIHDLGRQRL